ncbi:MAG: hypothetical protein LBD71_04170 [Treponema sp.]|jgi:hypothetical protein|nr:hypothetical protein [Treponema sp.]
MKFPKYPILILFAFSSFIAYSQELKPIDIDILVNDSENILKKMDKLELSDEYNSLGAAVTEKFERLWYYDDLTDEEFSELIERYKQLIDYKPPKEFENIFKEAGWKENGYRKFFTIFFGMICIYFYLENNFLENGFDEKDMEMRRLKILKIFNKHDLDIINSRMEDLNVLFQ